MKKKIERISKSLRWLKNDLRNEALKTEDETLQKKLWRWHYRAKDSEYEVDILMGQSDVRDVLKRAIALGLFDEEVSDLNLNLDIDDADEEGKDDESASPSPKKKKRKSKKKPPPDDDDGNLPKQKGLWDKPSP
jgi:hypothetical protein